MEVPMENSNYLKNYIEKFYNTLELHKLDAAIVPSWDEWESEMVQPKYNRLGKLCNFTGTNGLAVISTKTLHTTPCAFFTDGRYTLQARKQVPEKFGIFNFSCSQLITFLRAYYHNKRVGFDPRIIRHSHIDSFLEVSEVEFIPIENLAPVGSENTDAKKAVRQVEVVPTSVMGSSFEDKKKALFKDIENYNYAFIASPDTVSWFLNMRAIDKISTNETFSLALNAYVLLSRSGKDVLYVDEEYNFPKLANLAVKNLQDIEKDLNAIEREKLFISKNTPYVFTSKFLDVLSNFDTPGYYKCIKSKAECKQMREVHLKDGVILTKFLQALQLEVEKNGTLNGLDEYTLGEQLTKARAGSNHFICNSFAPIVGSGPNGAIIHYRAEKGECSKIAENRLLLIDSGGHYRWGTTDVTRTIRLSDAGRSAEELEKEKMLFTKVLQGMIELLLHEFDEETPSELDEIARSYLNGAGYDYPHSTGHGVGVALNVHEGPVRIGKNYDGVILPGMVLSIEPGVYLEGEFGIRIENLALVRQKSNGLKYFENLTFVPIQESLVDMNLLTEEQKDWLVEYNEACLRLR